MKHQQLLIFLLCIVVHFAPAQKTKTKNQKTENNAAVLASFSSGIAKTKIIEFVKNSTNPKSPGYIQPEDRIACFDNDGTLWAEQPLPAQIFFDFDRIRIMSQDHPEWKNTQPYKAVLENDMTTLSSLPITEILKVITTAESIDNVANFDPIVVNWLKTTINPHFHKNYYGLVYQPMMEVVDLLKANGFKIYVVSGGSIEFMRPWMPCIYGIPKEQIIGSTMKTEAVQNGDQITIKRLPELEHNDDHFGKVISIEKFIGKKPVIIFGNSDGDLEMMEYAFTNNRYPTLLAFVNHTDADREYKYDEKTQYGRLVKGLEVAKRNNWLIIDMKNDWKTIFAPLKNIDCGKDYSQKNKTNE